MIMLNLFGVYMGSENIMATTDEHGSKLPQSQIKKKDFSRMLRERRMQSVVMQGGMNPAFCNMCGYRVRSLNHESGSHHQQAPKVIEAKRKAALA